LGFVDRHVLNPFFMHALGVRARLALQALHRVLAHPRQTGGLSNAAAFRQVMQDGLGTCLGHPAVCQGRVAPFRKACATRAALQQTNGLILTVGFMHAEVARAAFAKVWARLVQLDFRPLPELYALNNADLDSFTG
jgi:hypothetical protein